MSVCEVVTDILDYEKVATPPNNSDVSVQAVQLRRNAELTRVRNVTKRNLYLAVRWYLLKNHRLTAGELPAYANPDPATYPADDPGSERHAFEIKNGPLHGNHDDKKALFFAVYGILLAESRNDPMLGKSIDDLSPGAGDEISTPIAVAFKKYLNAALAEYDMRPELFEAVYRKLREKTTSSRTVTVPAQTQGDPPIQTTHQVAIFRARQVAEIGRALIGEKTNANDSLFGTRFDRALATSLSGATEGPRSVIDIDLPDLEEGTEADIISDNVRALSLIYFAAMLEELKFFQVMDKVVEQFMSGALPIKRGAAGDPLYRYHREAQNRINEYERRGLYARSFGVAQGSIDELYPNREFSDLWIRFLAAVSALGREAANAFAERRSVSSEQVFKAGRDLAVNLSLHGYGLAHFAAVEVQTLIKSIKDTLSAQEILSAYGTRDIWQLVERVSNMYLGGAVNGVRQRTMATSGAQIIQWLADKSSNLVGSYQVLEVDRVLISHVERWLAVTGTPDSAVERFAEPVAVQSQRTIPDFALPGGAAAEAVRDAMSKISIPGVAMPNPNNVPQN